MSARELIEQARKSGVRLTLHNGHLRCTTPAGKLPPALRARLAADKASIIQALLIEQHGRAHTIATAAGLPARLVAILPDADLAACTELTDAALAAYLHACYCLSLMMQGELPPGYRARVNCAGCGAVWLPEGHPTHVQACPWCLHRLAGVSLPRPPIRCADCAHFQPYPDNPTASAGLCEAGRSARWAMQRHTCRGFVPKLAAVNPCSG